METCFDTKLSRFGLAGLHMTAILKLFKYPYLSLLKNYMAEIQSISLLHLYLLFVSILEL